MRAVVVENFGEAATMSVVQLPTPDPGVGQVRIKVAAAGINPVDIYNLTDPSWAGVAKGCVLGYDIAGTVDAIGSDVSADLIGAKVMAMTAFPSGQGGYAELAVVDAALVAPLAADADLIAAASVPLSAGTAWEVLQRLRGPGDRMLVLGASGGVGLFLIQLAAAAGVRPIGVGRTRNHSIMREFGASGCVDYTEDEFMNQAAEPADGTFDSIADLVGGNLMAGAQPFLRHDGQICAIAAPELDLDQVIDANQSFHGLLIRDDGDRTRHLAQLFGNGELRTHVTHVLPLEDAVRAHQLVESGEAGGKVVLTP